MTFFEEEMTEPEKDNFFGFAVETMFGKMRAEKKILRKKKRCFSKCLT